MFNSGSWLGGRPVTAEVMLHRVRRAFRLGGMLGYFNLSVVKFGGLRLQKLVAVGQEHDLDVVWVFVK